MECRLNGMQKVLIASFQPDEKDGIGQVIARADDRRVRIRLAIALEHALYGLEIAQAHAFPIHPNAHAQRGEVIHRQTTVAPERGAEQPQDAGLARFELRVALVVAARRAPRLQRAGEAQKQRRHGFSLAQRRVPPPAAPPIRQARQAARATFRPHPRRR